VLVLETDPCHPCHTLADCFLENQWLNSNFAFITLSMRDINFGPVRLYDFISSIETYNHTRICLSADTAVRLSIDTIETP